MCGCSEASWKAPTRPGRCGSRTARCWWPTAPSPKTKEQIVGFDIIECANLDEALEVAAAHPMAKFGMIEVRPFWLFEGT